MIRKKVIHCRYQLVYCVIMFITHRYLCVLLRVALLVLDVCIGPLAQVKMHGPIQMHGD